MGQDKIFYKKEGDAWFKRNQPFLNVKNIQKNDIPFMLLSIFDLKPQTVLELGASNGYRLEAIRRKYGSKCYAAEPSIEAIRSGRKNFPKIKFYRGLAHQAPIKNKKFDLIVVCFVLHWVDRKMISKTIKNIDNYLKDDGLLLLGDFLPDKPGRVKYHHLPTDDVWTYKDDYSKYFLAKGYEVVSKVTCDINTNKPSFNSKPENRTAYFLLRKKPGK